MNYAEVKFWDALDYIGVLAYFPLTKATNPSAVRNRGGLGESAARSWSSYSKAARRKQFLFVEIGYNESARAAAEPWAFKTGGEHAAEIQERCIEVALRLAAPNTRSSPGCIGGNGSRRYRTDEEENYRLQTAPIKALIAKHWKEATADARSR